MKPVWAGRKVIAIRGDKRRRLRRGYAEQLKRAPGDGELEDLGWHPISTVGKLNLVDVTTFVLAEAVRRWRLALMASDAARAELGARAS